MDDTTNLFDDGTILEVNFETKSGAKNPHGPWKIKGVMRVDVTRLTRNDIKADLLASWKIKRQRCREAGNRDEAYACMTEVVNWRDVGKVGTSVDHEAAFHSKFGGLSEEEQAEKIAQLTAIMKRRG